MQNWFLGEGSAWSAKLKRCPFPALSHVAVLRTAVLEGRLSSGYLAASWVQISYPDIAPARRFVTILKPSGKQEHSQTT
jgi:hypothetical protein